MTDGQWALLAPLLPAAGSTGGRGGRPEKWDRRLVLDAIFYLVRGGIAWRALPADFPPHQTVHALFRRLVRDYETLPATHEAMIWTAATWQLSNRLTR
ncbi:MAG TPA: transposase [Blastococcus sp.]